jgi:hypothetical protein
MQWNTQQVKTLIEEALADLKTKPERIMVGECGGDYDSEGIQIDFGNYEFLNVCGFHTGHTNMENGNSPSDMEVEMVEVSDGQDSRGGLNSDHEPLCIAYGIVCSTLRKHGFSVVPQLKDYF